MDGNRTERRLGGPDGSTLLGFLSVIGAATVLFRQGREVELRWTFTDGQWQAHLRGRLPDGDMELVDVLFAGLEKDLRAHPLYFTCLPDMERGAAAACFPAAERRPVCLEGTGPVLATTTALTPWYQTVRRDYWKGVLERTLRRTTPAHLARTLYTCWDFGDPIKGMGLRLSPVEDRRHARQWHAPTNDPSRAVWGAMLGANRLALESYPWWETMADGEELAQVGYQRWEGGWRWTWPLWVDWLELPALRTVLSLSTLQTPAPSPALCEEWAALGLGAVFRVRRFLQGKTLNFTPPECLFLLPPAMTSAD
jgi:hypothetical protein